MPAVMTGLSMTTKTQGGMMGGGGESAPLSNHRAADRKTLTINQRRKIRYKAKKRAKADNAQSA